MSHAGPTQRYLTPEDILENDAYLAVRASKRREIMDLKRSRRLAVGPYAMVYFENYDTMWHQIQEMLLIENGGEEQLADELEAYNPLIPQGSDLRVTLMFEIENPDRRKRLLAEWHGIEQTIGLQIGSLQRVPAAPVDDTGEHISHPFQLLNGSSSPNTVLEQPRTSSVHFLKFSLSPEHITAFKKPHEVVTFCIDHPDYCHMAQLPNALHEALTYDLGE